VPEPPAKNWREADLPYAELDVVTNFSFLRGASHADELMLSATEWACARWP
jgi:DNA polymerase III alpha subunit